MPRFLAALSMVLLLSACSSGPEPADPPAPPDPGPVTVAQNGYDIERSRWVGIGSYDACGLSWAIDLVQELTGLPALNLLDRRCYPVLTDMLNRALEQTPLRKSAG